MSVCMCKLLPDANLIKLLIQCAFILTLSVPDLNISRQHFLNIFLISSPEHKVLKVSCCDESMSIVSRALWVVCRSSCSINNCFNLYHSLGIFSRRQIDDIFLIFPRKQDLTFHANCLLRRKFAWNVISCFLRKIRKIFQNVVCWKFYPEC